jgi:hypothetical protein
MKLFKYSIFIWLFSFIPLRAQKNSFSFTHNGLTKFIMEEFKGVNKKELYDKTISWLNLNKQKSKIQLSENKKNEFICFEEIKSKILCDKYLEDLNCYDIRSTILISFYNNSYKFEVVKIEILIETNTERKWMDFSIEEDHQNKYFKKNGVINARYKMYPSTIETIFNSFNENLKNYILNSH